MATTSFAENPVQLLDHWGIVWIAQADDLDPLGVTMCFPVLGSEGKKQILQQLLQQQKGHPVLYRAGLHEWGATQSFNSDGCSEVLYRGLRRGKTTVGILLFATDSRSIITAGCSWTSPGQSIRRRSLFER